MNFSQSFISLEFNEEDSDLWGALQLIEPEKRSAFIKGALRRTLVAGLSPECFYSEGASPLMGNVRINSLPMTKSSEEEFIQANFDELAVQENSSSNNNQAPWEHLLYNIIGVEEDEAILNVLNKASISHNMLDEASLATEDISSELVQLKLNIETSVGESTPTEAEYGVPLPLVEVGVTRLDEEFKLMDNENPILMMQDFNVEDLKVNTETVQSIGVEDVLKQVIGEETDSEIIELLQSGEPLTST